MNQTIDVYSGLVHGPDGKVYGARSADAVARANGMQHAEHFVKKYDKKRLELDDNQKVTAETPLPCEDKHCERPRGHAGAHQFHLYIRGPRG